MLLTDLPRDILLEILDRLWEDSQPNFSSEEFIFRCRSMIGVGATCRALRIAALPYIYSELSLSINREALCKFLNDYKYIAAYIRKLTFTYSDRLDSLSPFLVRNVISQCTGLQTLDIICYNDSTVLDYSARMILEWLPPESIQSIECLDIMTNMGDILQCVQRVGKLSVNGDFSKLQDLKLDGRLNNRSIFDLVPNEVGSEILPQVRKLSLKTWLKETGPLGAFIAKMLPNVESLHLETVEKLAYTILSAYVDLGTRITELQIAECHPIPIGIDTTIHAISPYHLCEIIPKLSHRLTKFTIPAESPDLSPVCHCLFRNIDDWPLLVELTLSGVTGCEGLKPDLLHSAMTELARTHPGATILLERGRDLMVDIKPKGPKTIAPVEIFERLSIPFDHFYPPSPYYDEFYDHDHDFDLDVEDAMEEYFENENYEDDDYYYGY